MCRVRTCTRPSSHDSSHRPRRSVASTRRSPRIARRDLAPCRNEAKERQEGGGARYARGEEVSDVGAFPRLARDALRVPSLGAPLPHGDMARDLLLPRLDEATPRPEMRRIIRPSSLEEVARAVGEARVRLRVAQVIDVLAFAREEARDERVAVGRVVPCLAEIALRPRV